MAETVTNPPANQAKPADLSAHAARLQAAFLEELTHDDLRAIARKLIEQAKEGDRTSARIVLKYTLDAGVAAPANGARPKDHAGSAAFVADTARILREIDGIDKELRRQAAAEARAGAAPPAGQRR